MNSLRFCFSVLNESGYRLQMFMNTLRLVTNREFEENIRHDPGDKFASDDRGDNGDGDR